MSYSQMRSSAAAAISLIFIAMQAQSKGNQLQVDENSNVLKEKCNNGEAKICNNIGVFYEEDDLLPKTLIKRQSFSKNHANLTTSMAVLILKKSMRKGLV